MNLENYERMAIERALAECGGDAVATTKLLKIGRSTLYRRMKALGISRTRQSRSLAATGSFLMTAGPVSLESYERMALEHALDATGGDKAAAARLLRIGTSTLYRKLAEFGLG